MTEDGEATLLRIDADFGGSCVVQTAKWMRVDLLFSFSGLGFPIAVGLLAGWSGLFREPDEAVGVLNRYALYIAFPALIAAGLTGASFTLPVDAGFWLFVPVAMAVTVAVAGLLGRTVLPGKGGTLVLTGIFGNVAYVGLPLCERILGDAVLGLASLAVSIFVTCSLLAGPTLLLAWSPAGSTQKAPLGSVLWQPLLWSPVIGLALRFTPWMSGAHDLLAPVGRSAAPVALFLLGLYLFVHRAAAIPSVASIAHVSMKIGVFPLILAGMCKVGLWGGWLQVDAAQVFILLGATPTAIATFALAVEFDVGRDDVAQAIVVSTLVSAMTLPLISTWVLTLG